MRSAATAETWIVLHVILLLLGLLRLQGIQAWTPDGDLKDHATRYVSVVAVLEVGIRL